jgi:hypothetical protein
VTHFSPPTAEELTHIIFVQMYENKNWSLAEDHIHFTIGRQAANLKQISEATRAFAHLLTPASRQSPAQQAAFLREFLTMQQVLWHDPCRYDLLQGLRAGLPQFTAE